MGFESRPILILVVNKRQVNFELFFGGDVSAESIPAGQLAVEQLTSPVKPSGNQLRHRSVWLPTFLDKHPAD